MVIEIIRYDFMYSFDVKQYTINYYRNKKY